MPIAAATATTKTTSLQAATFRPRRLLYTHAAAAAGSACRVVHAFHVWAAAERAAHSDLDPAKHTWIDWQWRFPADEQPGRSAPVPSPAEFLVPAANSAIQQQFVWHDASGLDVDVSSAPASNCARAGTSS
ncbi:hypothetical protein V492_06989 [Pseudogymnoascus sp. VKM F-4246]|nr:hypothetical protein V492_06989 [Pseudogymnoascus sp. VKM F-4246]